MGMASERGGGGVRPSAAACPARQVEAAHADDTAVEVDDGAAVERPRRRSRSSAAGRCGSRRRSPARRRRAGAVGDGARARARARRGAGNRGAGGAAAGGARSLGSTSARSRATSTQITRPSQRRPPSSSSEDLGLVAHGLVAGHDQAVAEHDPARARAGGGQGAPRTPSSERRRDGDHVRGRAKPGRRSSSCVDPLERGHHQVDGRALRALALGVGDDVAQALIGLRGQLGPHEQLGERAEREEVAQAPASPGARSISLRGSGRRAPSPGRRWSWDRWRERLSSRPGPRATMTRSITASAGSAAWSSPASGRPRTAGRGRRRCSGRGARPTSGSRSR